VIEGNYSFKSRVTKANKKVPTVASDWDFLNKVQNDIISFQTSFMIKGIIFYFFDLL
jgi:hypothetical protein